MPRRRSTNFSTKLRGQQEIWLLAPRHLADPRPSSFGEVLLRWFMTEADIAGSNNTQSDGPCFACAILTKACSCAYLPSTVRSTELALGVALQQLCNSQKFLHSDAIVRLNPLDVGLARKVRSAVGRQVAAVTQPRERSRGVTGKSK